MLAANDVGEKKGSHPVRGCAWCSTHCQAAYEKRVQYDSLAKKPSTAFSYEHEVGTK